MRASLLRLGAEEHILLLAMHHVISDGWSGNVFARELTTLRSLLERVHPWQIEREEMQSSYMIHGHRLLDVTFEPRAARS